MGNKNMNFNIVNPYIKSNYNPYQLNKSCQNNNKSLYKNSGNVNNNVGAHSVSFNGLFDFFTKKVPVDNLEFYTKDSKKIAKLKTQKEPYSGIAIAQKDNKITTMTFKKGLIIKSVETKADTGEFILGKGYEYLPDGTRKIETYTETPTENGIKRRMRTATYANGSYTLEEDDFTSYHPVVELEKYTVEGSKVISKRLNPSTNKVEVIEADKTNGTTNRYVTDYNPQTQPYGNKFGYKKVQRYTID